MQIDLLKLKENIAAGRVKFQKIGKAFVISSVRFDPLTGENVEPFVEALELENLSKMETDLRLSADNLAFLISEFKKL